MGNSTTTTQRADPWAPAQPAIRQGLSAAQDLFNSGGFNIGPYQGNMVAGYDPMRAQADAMLPGAVQGAYGIGNQGTAAITRAMDPSLRSAGWDTVAQNTINRIMPGINSSFAGSGMTGSGLHAQNLGAGLASGLADVENQAWNQGENRALTAAGMVPGMQQSLFDPISYLQQAGGLRQQDAQSRINAAVLQDQQSKTAPMSAIQDYLALTSGLGSAFGVQSSTQRQNPGMLGLLGMGLQSVPFISTLRNGFM